MKQEGEQHERLAAFGVFASNGFDSDGTLDEAEFIQN